MIGLFGIDIIYVVVRVEFREAIFFYLFFLGLYDFIVFKYLYLLYFLMVYSWLLRYVVLIVLW